MNRLGSRSSLQSTKMFPSLVYHVFLYAALSSAAFGHSFLTYPTPMTHTETCRIGGNPGFEAHCSGPCPNPNYRPRYEMRTENPSATYTRGQTYDIHYAKNNHQGGFVRLSMVPITDMYNHTVHSMMGFFYGCWSSHGGYSCDEFQKHRDCGFDRENLAWKVSVTIPTVYPDGVYVLGYSWYGGGETYGSFGDYYDCAYVRIQGGPLTDTSESSFRPGPRYGDGCQSSVNRLGICTTEPCGNDYWSSKMTPAEFQDGSPTVYRWWYDMALNQPENQITVMEPTDFGVTELVLYDTGNEMFLDSNVDQFVDLNGIQGITIIPKHHGHIDYMEWVVNGKLESTRHSYPFSIGGSQVEGNHDAPVHERFYNFFDWPYPVLDKRVLVTAISHQGGRRQYYTKDLYFRRS